MTAATAELQQAIIDAINAQTAFLTTISPRVSQPPPVVTTLTASITRPADSNAYAANDAYAQSTSAPLTGGYMLLGAARTLGGSGKITDAIVVASAATAYVGELWLFNTRVTAIADNAAFTITDAEALTLVGIIPFSTSDTTAANAVSYITGLDYRYTCAANDTSLYFLVKVMGVVTPGSAEILSVAIKVEN